MSQVTPQIRTCDRRGELIICERSGLWAAAWRQAWDRFARGAAGEPPEIRSIETRSPAECLDALRAFPAAFVIVELTAENCERALGLLLEISTRHRSAAAAVAATRPMRTCQWRIREFGAVEFVVSPRELPALCRMVERHVARSPRAELGVEARIWASLPWGG